MLRMLLTVPLTRFWSIPTNLPSVSSSCTSSLHPCRGWPLTPPTVGNAGGGRVGVTMKRNISSGVMILTEAQHLSARTHTHTHSPDRQAFRGPCNGVLRSWSDWPPTDAPRLQPARKKTLVFSRLEQNINLTNDLNLQEASGFFVTSQGALSAVGIKAAS